MALDLCTKFSQRERAFKRPTQQRSQVECDTVVDADVDVAAGLLEKATHLHMHIECVLRQSKARNAVNCCVASEQTDKVVKPVTTTTNYTINMQTT